jgi:hypothetical protein
MFLERGPPGTKLGQELQELVRDILLVAMDLEECDPIKVNGLGFNRLITRTTVSYVDSNDSLTSKFITIRVRWS